MENPHGILIANLDLYPKKLQRELLSVVRCKGRMFDMSFYVLNTNNYVKCK